jgi:molybdopterin-guanine dinucleotide biosynthesis protein A
MGRDKATLSFGGELMLQRVVRLLRGAVEDIVVVRRRDQALPPLPGGVRVVHDEVEDQGPLGGLVPGLRATRAEAVYATACDVPFLNRALVELLFDRLGSHDVVVPRAGGYLHPLAAVYRTRVLPVLEALFAAGQRRPRDLFAQVDAHIVGADELRVADPDLLTLENLNTPEALEAARARLARGADDEP